jgi:hypothetical protein
MYLTVQDPAPRVAWRAVAAVCWHLSRYQDRQRKGGSFGCAMACAHEVQFFVPWNKEGCAPKSATDTASGTRLWEWLQAETSS